MKCFRGKAAYKDIALGNIYVFHKKQYEINREPIEDIEAELARFSKARQKAYEQLLELCEKTKQEAGKDSTAIIQAQQVILLDEEYIKTVEQKIIEESMNAEYSVFKTGMDLVYIFTQLESGMEALVDGENEIFIVEPDTMQKEQALNKIEAKKKENAKLQELIGKEDITLGGKKVSLFANVGSLEDIQLALENDAGGVGLFRSEFLYMGKNSLPTEQEQFEVYKQAAELVNGRKIIIRHLDIGRFVSVWRSLRF